MLGLSPGQPGWQGSGWEPGALAGSTVAPRLRARRSTERTVLARPVLWLALQPPSDHKTPDLILYAGPQIPLLSRRSNRRRINQGRLTLTQLARRRRSPGFPAFRF